MDFYIHQIGDIKNEKTYKRLVDILKSKMICSRKILEEQGVTLDYDNTSFELNIPDDKKYMYYEEDIHKDRVSLSDPHNNFIARAIQRRDHQTFTCFDYDYIAFAISRNIPLVEKEDTHGLALGEVQVKDCIDFEYVVGLILPIPNEQLSDESNNKIIETIANICEKNNAPLDIYNYEGELLYKRKSIVK